MTFLEHQTEHPSYLLSIENYGQLEKHPLRGAVFENLAMGELLKSRYNIGREPNLYFYREQSGLEVDAIMNEGGSPHLYEIKSGKTLRPDYLENMKTLRSCMPDIKSSTVIYDGESFPPTSINIRDI